MNQFVKSSRRGEGAAQARSKRLRPLCLCALTLGVVGAGLHVNRDWRETARREAYLPDLEAQARRDPQDGRLLALLGARYAEAHLYAPAQVALTKAVAQGEQNEAAWLTLAASYAAQGDVGRVNDTLALGMQNPDAAPALRAALDRANSLGGTATPIALAAAICPQGARWTAAHYATGSFLNGFSTWRGRRDLAHSGYATRQEWARAQPRNAQIQRLWGEALVTNRRPVEAVDVLRAALALEPNSPATHLALARALDAEGDRGAAGVEYIACLKRDPNNLTALLGIGQVALDKKLLSIGAEAYERAVKIAPNSADAWIGLGRAQYNQRLNMGRAQEAFATGAKLAPARVDYFIDYSNALRALTRNEEAETLLRRYLKATPGDARAHYLLGLLLLDHNTGPERETLAQSELRESLRLQPDVAAVEARLGRLLLDRGQASEAIPLLQTAIRHDTYNLEATLGLARAYRQAGRRAEAQAAQESAAQLSEYQQKINTLEDQIHRQPDNLKANQELAALYRQGGENDKAQRQDDMVYVLKTHPQQAKQGLTNIQRAMSLTVPTNDTGAGH